MGIIRARRDLDVGSDVAVAYLDRKSLAPSPRASLGVPSFVRF